MGHQILAYEHRCVAHHLGEARIVMGWSLRNRSDEDVWPKMPCWRWNSAAKKLPETAGTGVHPFVEYRRKAEWGGRRGLHVHGGAADHRDRTDRMTAQRGAVRARSGCHHTFDTPAALVTLRPRDGVSSASIVDN